MHIKTNIEPSSVQLAVLSICPLITVIGGVNQAVEFIVGTAICLFLSQLICWMFNRFLGNAVKVFACALTSAFVVVFGTFLLREKFSYVVDVNIYYIIFSSVILSSDFIYFRHKAAVNHTVVHFIRLIFTYSIILFVFAFVKEFLSEGTIFGVRYLKYNGIGFFATVASDFLVLGLLCAVFDTIFRWIDKQIENKSIKYQKYIKTIRDEKAFQYDMLRRQKLLVNDIEINNMTADQAEKIIQKGSENEAITSVEEVLSEETEEQPTDEPSKTAEDSTDENNDQNDKKKKKSKKSDDSDKKGGKE